MMGQSLEQILQGIKDGASIGATIASNQDNGIVGYATGSLIYHEARLSPVGSGSDSPAKLSTVPGNEMQFYFSDRKLAIDPPTGGFGTSPRQPFNANATEKLGMTIILEGVKKVIELSLFGNTSSFNLTAMGDVLVGLGPSLGNSGPGVFVVSFAPPAPQPR